MYQYSLGQKPASLRERRRKLGTFGLFRILYVPDPHGWQPRGPVNLDAYLALLRTNIRRPGAYRHKRLNTFLRDDPAHRDLNHWLVCELDPGETFADLPVIPMLNGTPGRPRSAQRAHAGRFSPFAALSIHLHQSAYPTVPFLQDIVDHWPPEGPSAFSPAAADPAGLRLQPHFPLVLWRAMKRDGAKHPRADAIAGLFLWWQGTLGDFWRGGTSAAIARHPPPCDLFDIFDVPDPPGTEPLRLRGNFAKRVRGNRKHNQ